MEFERFPRPLARSIEAVSSILGRLITREPTLQEQINNGGLNRTLSEIENTRDEPAISIDPKTIMRKQQDDYLLGLTPRNPYK